ncbi:hypothetical protein V1J52_22990 [Streptomyces sp. TRM 70351]|uniref:hypothetical protein n=1 Tax=Streptomyces sp. TRM 70351 TaxID=3116552 RepID=UPI002E7AEE77|nr:hypothetical protein [Streptomyces sp. TRM 70351]MEE1931009.1 hypothetical protein [Streptomyces sp. TRM 70351]
MLVLHVPAHGDALLADGGRIAATGPHRELAAARPGARERHWAGTIGPGRCAPDAAAFLERAYHPDPREADALGTGPLTGAALDALERTGALTDARRGHSARRGLQRLLADGVTALVGPFTHPAVRTAVRRSGLTVLDGPRPLTLAPGARADFTVTAPDGTCLATVIAARILHRAS